MTGTRNYRRRVLATTALVLPLLCSQVVLAQSVGTPPPTGTAAVGAQVSNSEGLGEIIVTGTKLGAQNLQTTPVAVSVVDSKLLDQQGLNTTQDVANYVPNVTFTRGAGSAIVYIRGIGSNSTSAGSDPSVTQQVDGVYIARPSAQTGDFLDVARIEVLRGPQGTLYGRNSVGGTINIVSRQPSDVFGGRFRVGYGAYNEKTVEAFVTGPIAGDTLTGSLATTYRDHEAYFHNIVPNVPSVGAAQRFGTRAQLRWAPTVDLDMTLRGDYSLTRDVFEGLDQLLLPVAFPAPLVNSLVRNPREVAINVPQTLNVDTGGVSLDINYRLGNGFSVKSITAWRKLKTVYNQDNDATEVPVQFLRLTESQEQVSQEFNLNYKSNKFNGVAGLYYFSDRDYQQNFSQVPPSIATPAPRSAQLSAAPIVHTRSYAAFAQGSYEIVQSLRIVLGARYTTETKQITQNFSRTSLNPPTLGASAPGFPVIFATQRTDKAFTPKASIDFQLTDNAFLYASVTRGFKSGGFNNAAVTAATAGFAPEKLWAYEAGAKTQFFDRKLRVNLTGFIYDYTDLQVRQLIGVGNAVIANAASARVKGVELETLLRPVPDVQLSGNVSYLHARYNTFKTASVPGAYASLIPNQNVVGGVATFDASGREIEGSPEWSGIVGIDYTPMIGKYRFTAHADYAVRGKVFYDPSNIAIASQGSYGLVNANIGIGPEHGWKVEAFVKNLADKNYFLTIGGNGLVPGAIAGDPRTYGLRVGLEF